MHNARSQVAVAAFVLAFWAAPLCAQVLGRNPSYSSKGLTAVPNSGAIGQRIWAPGLDEGYVPQGLAFAAGSLYVSAYKSEDPKQGRGPCRLFRVDTATGAVTGALDLPPACGHAGGIGEGRAGRLFVADTRVVFEVELAGSGETSIGRVARTIKLTGQVKGSFAASTRDALWLGTYDKEPGARFYRFPFAALKPVLAEADATASIPLPIEAQGAAFDTAGRLWITRSGSRFGELVELDPASGAVLRRYAMPAGLEDLSVDDKGGLWGLSEAGSKRWLNWPTFYPLVFRLDPTKLR